jgi:hypothetical protein
METDRAIELSPHYYLDNFHCLCDTVQERYADLLTEAELALLENFRRLATPARCLYVRLISRVGPWFRTDRLHYPEIGDLSRAVRALQATAMAVTAKELDVEALGRLYSRAELQRAFRAELAERSVGDKPSLLAAIEEAAPDPAARLRRVQAVFGGEVIAPVGPETVAILQLLFFGNRRQSLTEFVLADLGVARYYPYPLDSGTRLFDCREALEEYLACAALADAHRELVDSDAREALSELAEALLARAPRFGASERRWYRQCNALARDLERQGEDALAERLYAASGRPPARERRARLLERRGDLAGAAALCETILADPWGEEEAAAAMRILPRVRRKLGGGPARRRREAFPRLDLRLERGDAPVELLAAAQLQSEWSSVHYVENSLMNALFGLAFWEQIFAPVPGAFHNPFQSAPADMYEPGFRQRRREILRDRLERLAAVDLQAELVDAYRRYCPYQCRWVNWRQVDEALVRDAARAVPADHLLAVWERMLFDPEENRRGFPDLLALGERPGDYCLIEVKAPGDALQESQRRWLRYFVARQMPATVAWVAWSDD